MQVVPLFEVGDADLVEAVAANGEHTSEDGESGQVLAGQVTLVSDGLVAASRR